MAFTALRSPHDKVAGLVYFGRMLDKIRLHAAGELPADYRANLGDGFDKMCVQFLGIDYAALTERVKAGGTDDDVFAWCREQGRPLTEQDVLVWNEFMRKRGWNDAMSARLVQRKAECGLAGRDEIQTFFDFIDADEGRAVGEK